MAPRLFVTGPIVSAAPFRLPDGAARHVRVLRLGVGAALTLFDGSGHEWPATIAAIARDAVEVEAASPIEIDRELPLRITLAVGMPANDRMDALVEKATELGAAAIQPLECERSVLRLSGARAVKKLAHWQAIAIAACEQCGRNRLPVVHPVRRLVPWLDGDAAAPAGAVRLLLGWHDATPLAVGAARDVIVLSGPEGGLTDDEQALARRRGFLTVSLGMRTLRADTAPLAMLAHLGLR